MHNGQTHILQRILFKSVSDHFGTLSIEGLIQLDETAILHDIPTLHI